MTENAPEAGGDAACWAHLVCEECGAVRGSADASVPCPRCGTIPADASEDGAEPLL